MTPKEVVEKWVVFFNNADAESLSELYSKNAINHQVVNEPVCGRENIKKMFEDGFSNIKMTCVVENIFNDGDWAILEWKDPLGLRGCGFFRVVDSKIEFQRGYWDKLSFLKNHNLPIKID